MSIDVEGNDYWIWKAITTYAPRVIVIEYNSSVPPDQSKTVAYDPAFQWDAETSYFGASLLALQRLGNKKGYALVGCDSSGTNAFFVRQSLIQGRFLLRDIRSVYRPPTCWDGRGHPPHPQRTMLEV